MILIGFALLILALSGAPLFAVIGATALIGFYTEGIDLAVVAIEIYRLSEMPVLLAIPLFTFAGYLMGESQAPTRLVRLSHAFFGWLPGGLPIIAILISALFTAFTGASGVTIIALGALLYPALAKAGYAESFNLGLITTSGSLGLLFAPALPLILYVVVAQQMNLEQPVGVNDMFLAGILPGLLMLLLLGIWSMLQSKHSTEKMPGFSHREMLSVLRDALWELPLPVVVLGGIYSGYFAVSEAAAVTALYVLLIEVFVKKDIPIMQLPSIMQKSMLLVGGILIILGVAMPATNYMIDTEIPSRLFALIHHYIDSQLTFLIVLNLFLLLVGMFLDIFSALVILVPIILPLAIAYNIHPIHFGIIFLANMQLGYLTPPLGMNLFIASYRFDKPVIEIVRAAAPFFLLLLLAVVIITYWPTLSLILIT